MATVSDAALRRSSLRYYEFQLKKHVIPALGSYRLCDLTRPLIQQILLERKCKGYSISTLHGIRMTLIKVLNLALDDKLLEENPARAIRLADRESTKPQRLLSSAEARKLVDNLTDPCRTIVTIALLAGMRIGEILGLRWKRLDLLRGTIEVAETFSDGQFGAPKTKTSRRVIPMGAVLRGVLESHRLRSVRLGAEELVFCTATGTPLNPKNLYNRVLGPTCDRLGVHRVSWHAFRHMSGTLLGEVAESVKTVQAILGHSDLETTLNTYMHVIPESQRRAVEGLAGVLFPDVASKEGGSIN